MGTTLDRTLGEKAEPALDLIDPRALGRCEVEMIARAFGQPCLDDRRLVRRIVVEHDMDIEVGGHVCVDLVEEPTKLDGAMPCMAFADDLPGQDVESSKESRCAVPLVVVRAALDLSRT